MARLRLPSGFTLLEVIVALALLSFTIAGIVLMGTTSMSGNTRSQDEAAGLSLAIAKLEDLKNTGYGATCSSPNPETIGIYSRLCSISSGTLAGDSSKDFTVTVQWTGGGSLALTTTVINPTTMSSGALQQFPTVALKSWSSY